MLASELHKELNIKTNLRTWLRRISKRIGHCEIFEYEPEIRRGGKKPKDAILNNEQVELIRTQYSLLKPQIISQNEHGALCAIEQLLNIKLDRQFKVGKYRIDGYHKESNTAYEIDEPQHFIDGELREGCVKRQAYIEKKLKCKFVRIKV